MTLDDVPADTIMELTPELDRLFRFAQCVPTCHACQKPIRLGKRFQLLSYLGSDEMLCELCGRPELEAQHQEKLKTHIWKPVTEDGFGGYYVRLRRGGYSRPSRV